MNQPVIEPTILKAQRGKSYIGVGVGAVFFDDQGRVFLARRGPQAKNERGTWEIPGGGVEFGETLAEALTREMFEELGIQIKVGALVQVCDHILPDEGQHWVSPTYLCEIQSGTPQIMEPGKCDQIGWFALEEALQLPLSKITRGDIEYLLNQQQ